MTPAQLSEAAKCYCFNDDVWKKVVAYLLSLGGSGGPCPQDMQVAWTPTNVNLGEELGFFTFGDIPGVTSITFNQTTSLAGFDIESTTQITSISFPNLVSVDPSNTQGGSITLVGNSVLASISAPLLSNCRTIGIRTNPVLTSASFPSLTTTPGAFDFEDNVTMTSISVPLWTPLNAGDVRASGCALTAASVNHILVRCAANAGFIQGSVALDGGTNAAPSGAGIAAKTDLIGRGVIVTTN